MTDADTDATALSHRRRRAVLGCVEQHNVVTLADLADELAVQEHGTPIDEIPADAVTELYLELYHNHVPVLADAGLVAYDQEGDLVAITDTGKRASARFEERLIESGSDDARSYNCTEEGSC
ncbi:DUF7344 domain-containing protein [Natronococcus occultus]|nr:hypothetical protein [Natronococcus occultus]